MDIEILKAQLFSDIFPLPKLDKKTKLASVLVIIYGKNPTILMIQKSKLLNKHAGEIAFPGGQWTEDDRDLLETALRETKEEIGLNITRKDVIGQLENVRTLNSGFTITPFVTIVESIPKLKISSEIDSVFHIPLFSFLKTLTDDQDPNHRLLEEMYTFSYENKIVWGASARILKNLANRLTP